MSIEIIQKTGSPSCEIMTSIYSKCWLMLRLYIPKTKTQVTTWVPDLIGFSQPGYVGTTIAAYGGLIADRVLLPKRRGNYPYLDGNGILVVTGGNNASQDQPYDADIEK
jgi:hypothetical protein